MSGFELLAALMRLKAASSVTTFMSRKDQLNPMRFLVLLGVTWAAGTLLFAAEQTPRPAPPATAPAAAAPAAESAKPPANESADPSVAQAEPDVQAAEPEEPAAEEAQTQEPDAEEPTPSSAKEKSENAQRASAADKGSPKRFVPSEQVRADFDVSFPIDI